jgi:hypothetical protein
MSFFKEKTKYLGFPSIVLTSFHLLFSIILFKPFIPSNLGLILVDIFRAATNPASIYSISCKSVPVIMISPGELSYNTSRFWMITSSEQYSKGPPSDEHICNHPFRSNNNSRSF